MGQRLVIDITGGNKEPLAAIYFHWSAYTHAAMEKLNNFINAWDQTDPNKEDLLRFLEVCQMLGYGMSYKDTQLPQATADVFQAKPDRNRGIFALAADKKAYRELKNWGESNIDIDLHDRLVTNSVYYIYQSVAEYNSDVGDPNLYIDPATEAKLPQTSEQIDVYSMDNAGKIMSIVENMPSIFINKDGSLYEKIL